MRKKRSVSAVQRVRMPEPIEVKNDPTHKDQEEGAEFSKTADFQSSSTFPPIEARPLTSLSYAEKRDCISDVMALGSLRAFDAAHKHHTEQLEKDFERQWKEQERLRIWRASQARSKISTRRKDRDRGVLENIVNKRNQQRREYLTRGVPTESLPLYMNRHQLPREDRAVYQRPHHVFFWG